MNIRTTTLAVLGQVQHDIHFNENENIKLKIESFKGTEKLTLNIFVLSNRTTSLKHSSFKWTEETIINVILRGYKN